MNELLHVLFPSHKNIDSNNVDYLLALADEFHIAYVVNESEKFLMEVSDKEISVNDKLLLADRYKLSKLQVSI